MPEFERWPGYTEQSWQQRFVTLDAKYKERGDAAIIAAYSPSQRWLQELNIAIGETVRNELEDAIRNAP